MRTIKWVVAILKPLRSFNHNRLFAVFHSATLRVYLRFGFGSVISRTGNASISGAGSA
jgi:hypothetical protein